MGELYDWFLSNLYLVGIIGGFLFLASFCRFKFWTCRPIWFPFFCGLSLLIAVAVGVYSVATGTPGREEVVDEGEILNPTIHVPTTALERLRRDWDSEANANWPVAGTLATISEIAYLPPVDAKKEYDQLGLKEFMPIVAGSMIGYVISHDDVTVVAFRGTDFEEISDWLSNLDRSPTDTSHGEIHAGFYNAYMSMKPQVMSLLSARKPKHLWITGHSLGGAIALVCAYDMVDVEKRQIDGLVTFGQPMVARKALAGHLDSLLLGRYVRFVNDADVVPRVPPSYAPCGSLVWFTANGIKRSRRMMYGANSNEAPETESDEPEPLTDREFRQLQTRLKVESTRSDRLPDGTQVFGAGPPLIEDHSMEHYVEKVRRLLKEIK